MRHFIAYHNSEKMGRRLDEGEPLRLLSNKPIKHLIENTVWFITGEGENPRRYSLGSMFRVAEVGEADQSGFRWFATGPGQVFRPPIRLNDADWFPEVLRTTGNFGLGVQEIKDDAVIAGLRHVAMQAGHQIG